LTVGESGENREKISTESLTEIKELDEFLN
jgi:hypothetical protein